MFHGHEMSTDEQQLVLSDMTNMDTNPIYLYLKTFLKNISSETIPVGTEKPKYFKRYSSEASFFSFFQSEFSHQHHSLVSVDNFHFPANPFKRSRQFHKMFSR